MCRQLGTGKPEGEMRPGGETRAEDGVEGSYIVAERLVGSDH
jgi:hypothetical protein